MGWCSGTEIFDVVCEHVLENDSPMDPIDQEVLIADLYRVMRNHDWDCESDSDYYDHPIVQKVMKRESDD